LVGQKLFKSEDFSYAAAERFRSSMKKNKETQAIYAAADKKDKARVKKLEERVNHYVKAVQKLEGNVEVGRGFFQSCLACHAVGDKGYNIAPALDGSSTRELHALITAIVNPDVAVEGGYNLHRVVKKDGTVAEGLTSNPSLLKEIYYTKDLSLVNPSCLLTSLSYRTK